MMADHQLYLAAVAAMALTWWLCRSLRQMQSSPSETGTHPRLMWRQQQHDRWSEWRDVDDSCARLETLVDQKESPGSMLVQFAVAKTPGDAPSYTENVAFVSQVRVRTPHRTLIAAGSRRAW